MKQLLLVCTLLWVGGTASAQRTGKDYAVFFIASKFDHEWVSLSNIPDEVNAITTELREQYGFDVKIVSDASRSKIVQTLGEYKRKQYGTQDQLLLFFSMHGVHDAGSDQGYLVPKDGLYEDPTYESWYSHAALRDLAHSIQCPRVLVALDACYSGIFGKGRDRPIAPPWENDATDCQTKLKKAFNAQITRKYLTAGGDTRVPAKSIFAAQWKVALQSGGGEDGILSYLELLSSLDEYRETRPTWGNFVPGTDGDFVFVHKNGCTISATPPSENHPDSASDLDKKQWREAKTVNTLDAYRKYLRNCGDYCLFKEDAEAAISSLTSSTLLEEIKPNKPESVGKQEVKEVVKSHSTESPRTSDADPVLFKVGNKSVPASEFVYIYEKVNQDKADFSEQSLRDYLGLYTNFKIKVEKARDTHMDTISSIINEVESYRKQLSKSYLEDKEVTDKLIRETFDRMQQDVDISHIFVVCAKDAPAKDTLKAYNRAFELLKMLKNGKSFEQVAVEFSEDKTGKDNRGHLGFVTAMLPDGYYEMEKAIYAAKPGAFLGPIRTNSGYHIVKVNSFRKARGEMEVAQILIRKSATGTDKSKLRIDSAYALLQGGQKWDDICARYSEDKTTAAKSGYIGFFGINKYQNSFEDAAFALTKDGDYSRPIETSLGWHIIKRISSRPIGTFEQKKRSVTNLVKRDSRSELATQAFISRIKKENAFIEYPKILSAWSDKQTAELFCSADWKPGTKKSQDVLLRYNQNTTFTVADFEDYCTLSNRDRMRGAGVPVQETISKLYKAWSDETSIQIEGIQLEKKYPEFHSLMREYEEGILLFEVLKQNVWDMANSDSIGLERYFKASLSDKYKWNERARVSIYTLKSNDSDLLKKVNDFAAGNKSAEVLKKFNKKEQGLTVMEMLYEKGKNADIDKMWNSGSISSGKVDSNSGTASFMKVEQIVPPVSKTLAEARGYAVADYQDFLEKQWVDALRKEYKVTINDAVLTSLIRK